MKGGLAMKRMATVILVVLALGMFSISVSAEDVEPTVVIGMVAAYTVGSSITVNDEYTGSQSTFSIDDDAIIDGNIQVGSYVEVEAQGGVAVYINLITQEEEE